jgi:hypothetical protein
MGFGGNVVPALLLAGHPPYQITAVENRRVSAERVHSTNCGPTLGLKTDGKPQQRADDGPARRVLAPGSWCRSGVETVRGVMAAAD